MSVLSESNEASGLLGYQLTVNIGSILKDDDPLYTASIGYKYKTFRPGEDYIGTPAPS